jgi:DHA2 family multidrug resistance protein
MATATTSNFPVGAIPVALPIAKPKPKVNKWLVTLSITFGTLMGTIDASIINVAIPHIRGSVGATVEEITWISTGFALANVLVMPLTAFLGRQFGQKRVYMFCLGLFLVGSALCGIASSLTTLVIFRVIQGFGAGALQPTEQAILRQTFPPKEQGTAMALFALAIMIGPAIGPTLGGYIVDHYSWPWIFYINLPVGALGLFMVANFVHEDEEIKAANANLAAQQRKHMDWIGITFMSVGLCALQYVLEEGSRDDWFDSRVITGLTLLSAFSLAAFVVRELTAKVPAVDLRLFKDKTFLSGTLVGSIMFAMLMSLTFLLPVFMEELLGFTAVQSGLALMPRTLIMMLFIPIVGKLYNVVPPGLTVAVGVIFFFVGAVQMSHYNLETTSAGVISALLIQGFGFSCLFVPLNTVALASIPRHKMSDATGLNSLFRQIGGSIGLAIFATKLSDYAVAARASVGAHVTEVNPAVAARLAAVQNGMMARGFDAITAKGMAMASLYGSVAQQGMVLSFDRVFLLAGICFLFVLPLVFFLKRPDIELPGPKPEIHME